MMQSYSFNLFIDISINLLDFWHSSLYLVLVVINTNNDYNYNENKNNSPFIKLHIQ